MIISNEEKLVSELVEKFPNIQTIIKNVNTKNTNIILGKENINIYGDGYSDTIELTSTVPARMTKNILSANRVIINLKDIEISKNLYTKYQSECFLDFSSLIHPK